MQMDKKAKNARMKLAREAAGAGRLTGELAETLIDRVYVYPGDRLDIAWKMKDFCVE